MLFYLETWVLGGIAGVVEKREGFDFEVKSIEAAKQRMKKVVGELEVKHQVSDRFVRARLYREGQIIASW